MLHDDYVLVCRAVSEFHGITLVPRVIVKPGLMEKILVDLGVSASVYSDRAATPGCFHNSRLQPHESSPTVPGQLAYELRQGGLIRIRESMRPDTHMLPRLSGRNRCTQYPGIHTNRLATPPLETTGRSSGSS